MNHKLILFSLCAVLLAGCAKEEVKEEAILRSVEVATVGKDSITSSFSYSGKAAPAKEISVVPTIPGEVVSFSFDVGDTVKENQVLFSVDSSTLADQMRSAQANYNVAVLNLENAERSYNNNKTLFDQGIISKTEMDQTTLGFETAKANIEALNVNMDILKKQIGDCTVTSPMTGVVVSRNVERGSLASQAAPAYVIMDLSTIKVEVGVSEQAVNNIHLGDEVQVAMTAASADAFTGKVATISPASGQTGTYLVKIEIGNKDGIIKSGMLADVSFVSEKADDVLVLPISTVITKDGESYIYTVENNVAKKTPVTLGIETGENVEITTDLPEGTQVVTRGQTYLTDGEQIEISTASDSTEKPAAAAADSTKGE